MPKMQLITGKIALSESDRTIIVRDQFDPMSPGEVLVLNLEHGAGACFDLACIGYVDRSVEDEVLRLENRGYREEFIEKAMPGTGHMQRVPMELPELKMVKPRPVPKPDIAAQKADLSNRILEMGGTPPPQNFPIERFNQILADLMEAAGVTEKQPEEPFEVSEAAEDRVEKRILARRIEEAGGKAPAMDVDIDEFLDALMAAETASPSPDRRTASEIAEVEETPREEKARLKGEIARLGGKVPPNFAKVEKFRDALASCDQQAA